MELEFAIWNSKIPCLENDMHLNACHISKVGFRLRQIQQFQSLGGILFQNSDIAH